VQSDWGVEFSPWLGWAGAALAIAVTLWLVLRLFRTATVPLRGPTAKYILLCRLIVVAVLLLPLLRVSMYAIVEEQEKQPLTVLVDASRSMSLRSGPSALTRWEQAQSFISDNRERFERIARKYDIEWKSFDANLKPSTGKTGPNGRLTAIGTVIQEWRSGLSPGQPAPLLIVSDGRSNSGPDAVEEAAKLMLESRPIYTVGVGDRASNILQADASVEDLIMPLVVNNDTNFEVGASVWARGLAGVKLEATLIIDSVEVETKPFTPDSFDDRRRITFQCKPYEPGNHFVTIRIVPVPSEVSTENNELSGYIKVRAGAFKVLYVESRLRYEFTFLRRSMAKISGLDLDTMIIRGIGGTELAADPGIWRKYNLIILGDVPASLLGVRHLEAIKQRVESGGALLTLGGLATYGPGGYAESPLKEVLPFEMRDTDGQKSASTHLIPTADASQMSAFQIFGDSLKYPQLKERFVALPALSGFVEVSGVKPLATLLATSDNGSPLMATSDFGRGRVMSMTVDTTFHWAFNELEGEKDTRPAYENFWRKLILHLLGADKVQNYTVELNASSTSVTASKPVDLILSVMDKDRKPVKDAEVLVLARDAKGATVQIPMGPLGEDYVGKFAPEIEGHYVIEANALLKGAKIGSDEVRVFVFSRDRETANPDTDFATLEALAARSGGLYADWRSAEQIFLSLQDRSESYKRTTRKVSAVWAEPWPFLVALLFLTIEWVLRKKRGLP